MPSGIVMTFDDVHEEHYEEAMSAAGLDLTSPGNTDAKGEWPEGLLAHYAGSTPMGGWCVVDVWDTDQNFERFQERLGPVMQRIGIPPPSIIPFDVYNSHLAPQP